MRLLAKVAGWFSPKVRENWARVESQLAAVREIKMNIELFSQRYVPLGWVNFDRMSTTVLSELAGTTTDEGELILTRFHLDPSTLQVLGYRFNLPQFQPWASLYERALERCQAEDFLSAVPLLLIIIDGICTTNSGKHPFSGGADAEVFDTLTSGSGGLAEGLKVLGATRRKLSLDAIDAPFRHGIVHGLNPNFGHPVVAAKALNLLQATTDYFLSVRDEAQRLAKAEEEQRPASFQEVADTMRRTAALRAALDSWQPRPDRIGELFSNSTEGPADEAAPETIAVKYLQLLAKSNYGAVAALHVDYPQRPIAFRAGELRQELKGLRVTDWVITSIRDAAASITIIGVELQVAVGSRTDRVHGELRMMYADSSFEPMVRGALDGQWFVMPKLTTDLWVKNMELQRQ
jgi:hypothetical protein